MQDKAENCVGSTKGLHEHLKRVHDITVLKRKLADEESHSPSPPKRDVVQQNDNTLSATLARMTARDGLPFRVFVTSPDLRRGLIAMGFGNLPHSENHV